MPTDARGATGARWETVRRSDVRLRRLLDRNLAGVYRIGWDGTILACNEAFARTVGVESPSALIGQSVQPFYADPVDRTRLLARLDSEGDPVAAELCLKQADGTIVWVLSTAMRVEGEEGAPEVEGTLVDITAWKRTTDALLDSEAQLRSVVRTAGSAIVCTRLDQRIIEFNPAAERIFGLRRQDVLGQRYAGLFPPAVRAKIDRDLHRIAAGASVTDFENAIARRDGGVTVVLWNIQPLLDGDGIAHGVVMVGQDITSRQRAEESLLRQAQYLRALTAIDRAIMGLQRPEAVAAAVLQQIDHIGALLPCRGASVLAVERGSVEPRLLAAWGQPDAAHGFVPLAGAPARPRPALIARDAEGGRRTLRIPLEAQGEPLGFLQITQDDDGRAVASSQCEIAGQIADRLAVALHDWRLFEQAEDARRRLEALSTRLVDVQEAERRRLAADLHDEIGQGLTALLLQLEAGGAGAAAGLVRDLVGQIRDLSLDLRPGILDDFGLLPALLWHAERFGRQTGIRVDVGHQGIDRRFAARVETAAYRIVQEALTNVARHARAREVCVGVTSTAGEMRIEIEDSGAGFDPSSRQRGASLGLSGMRERATLLGGRFSVRSSPGSGTLVHVVIPLDVPAPGAEVGD